MKHCPICNASSSDIAFFGEFCGGCMGEKLMAELPGSMKMQVCKDCHRIRFGRDYLPNERSSIEQMLKHKYKDYKVSLISKDDDPITRISVQDKGSGLRVEKDVELEYETTLCETCSRRRGGYFESTIQFRGTPERINQLIVALQHHLEKNNGFIAKIVDVHNGVDVYVSNRTLTTTFLSRKNLNHIDSYTLHTEKKGKRLYRSTYSVRV